MLQSAGTGLLRSLQGYAENWLQAKKAGTALPVFDWKMSCETAIITVAFGAIAHWGFDLDATHSAFVAAGVHYLLWEAYSLIESAWKKFSASKPKK